MTVVRFLADENIMAEIVAGLRNAGHDVIAIAEALPSAADEAVLRMAVADARILLTEVKDFGDLAVRRGLQIDGSVLLALRRMSPSVSAKRALDAIQANLDRLAGNFLVIEANRTRSRAL